MTEEVSVVSGILLAAGSSQRFGDDKLLHRLPDGRPMAEAAASSLLSVCDRPVAVVRSQQVALAALLEPMGCEVVFVGPGDRGMGDSLATAVRATAHAGGWIVALADMPYIDPRSHRTVLSALHAGASLAAPVYRGRRGHPVGFSQRWLKPLAAMTGDRGGRTLLESHADQLQLCPVDDPGVVRDIDTPEDLLKSSRPPWAPVS